MNKEIKQQVLTGERALFMSDHLNIVNTTFADGESPLKESSKIMLDESFFRWKYPLWYCEDIKVSGGVLFKTARSGIWYTHRIQVEDCMIEAPKTFRRASHITLTDVELPNAQETLWHCEQIKMKNVLAKGDYFAKDSRDIEAEGLSVYGNYAFDGCKNISIQNSKILSKDAFWNCENVVVKDSFVSGEYLAWNTKNITFINCTIESLQGLCYIENLKIENCKIFNTNLAFEYSTVDVECVSHIDSVKNPIEGTIKAKSIGEIIQDDQGLDHSLVRIVVQ